MIKIKVVQRTMQNRRLFRTLARDNCGESMEPGENEIMYFAFKPTDSEKQASSSSPIACGSLLPFQKNCKDASSRDYYHWITYIFVHERYKGEGYGSLLLQHMQYDAWLIARHPIRADVAHKAVNFFTKNGYVINGKVWTPIAGSSYFRRLHPMQIDFKIPQPEEEWDPC